MMKQRKRKNGLLQYEHTQMVLNVLSHEQLLLRDKQRVSLETMHLAQSVARDAADQMISTWQKQRSFPRNAARWLNITIQREVDKKVPHIGHYLGRDLAMTMVEDVARSNSACSLKRGLELRQAEEAYWALIRDGVVKVQTIIDFLYSQVAGIRYHPIVEIIEILETEGYTSSLRGYVRQCLWEFVVVFSELSIDEWEYRAFLDLTNPTTNFSIEPGLVPQLLPTYWEDRSLLHQTLWFQRLDAPISNHYWFLGMSDLFE